MSADDYSIEWMGPRAVVTLPAEIDVTNADRAREVLLAATGQGPAVLIIDMSQTTFCDSAGVQAIVVAYRQATGTQFRLVATAVARILSLVGIGEIIPIDSSLDAALAATAPGR
jgi:anti-sigma B factor antagonist